MKKVIIIAAAILFAAARLSITKSPVSAAGSYQAFAHLFVGGLFGAAACGNRFCLWTGLALSMVELLVFLLT